MDLGEASLTARPSVEPICTNDHLFSGGQVDLNNNNANDQSRSTEPAKPKKQRKSNLKPVVRNTRSKTKANKFADVSHEAGKFAFLLIFWNLFYFNILKYN
jgi:hypothetical protein